MQTFIERKRTPVGGHENALSFKTSMKICNDFQMKLTKGTVGPTLISFSVEEGIIWRIESLGNTDANLTPVLYYLFNIFISKTQLCCLQQFNVKLLLLMAM